MMISALISSRTSFGANNFIDLTISDDETDVEAPIRWGQLLATTEVDNGPARKRPRLEHSSPEVRNWRKCFTNTHARFMNHFDVEMYWLREQAALGKVRSGA